MARRVITADAAQRGRPATAGRIAGRYALSVGLTDMPAPDGWRWVKLADIARLESGHTPSRRFPEYWDGDIPWIGIPDASAHHGRTITETNQCATQDGIDNSAARVLPAKTVCLSRTASIGYVTVMGRPMATSQDFANWVCSHEIEPYFLMQVLLAERESLFRFAHGTTHQTIYFPELKALHVCLPPLAEQQALCELLGALDDRIELNHRMAGTMEEVCRVHLDDRLQQGWADELGTLADLADHCRETVSPMSLPADTIYVGLEHMPRASITLMNWGRASDVDSVKSKFRRGDILFGKLRPYFQKVVVAPCDGVCSTDVLVVRPRDPRRFGELLYHMSSDELCAHATGGSEGTRMPRASWEWISRYKVPRLSRDASAAITAFVEPFVARMLALTGARHTLTDIREALRPRLLSGELRVRDVEREVALTP